MHWARSLLRSAASLRLGSDETSATLCEPSCSDLQSWAERPIAAKPSVNEHRPPAAVIFVEWFSGLTSFGFGA
jgi:hypothetical protein